MTRHLLLLALLLPGAAAAQEARLPEFAGIRVGFADQYKSGLWTPLELTLRGGSEALVGRVHVSVADSDGVPCSVTAPEPAAQVLPGQDAVARVYVRFGHTSSSLRAEFRVGDRTVAQHTFEAADQADAEHFREALVSRALLVQVGPGSLGLEEAASLARSGGDAPAVARLDDVAGLPTRWYGYEGVDVLLLSTREPDVFRKLAAQGAQVEALDQWIRMGGKLVLCVGSQAEEILREGAPLARFAPGRLSGILSLHAVGALEEYAKSQNPIPHAGRERGEIRVARLADVRGKVAASEADLPLVVCTPRGFGQVIFFAADLDGPLLSRWSDRKLLVARLLDLPTAEAAEDSSGVGMHYGFSDMAGQLRSALDRFPGVRLVPFSVVALLAVLFLLCIGPGDYFFLRKVLRRMEWTWLTFPAIVLLFGGGAYLMAYRLKGDRVHIHQVDLVDFDGAGNVRGTSWMNLFSPRTETFNLSLQPRLPGGQTAVAGPTIAWMGLPGNGLGGMDQPSRSGGSLLGSGQYAIAPGLKSIQGVPIPVWSSKSFTARWLAQCPGPIDATLTDEGRVPRGTVTSRLDFPLSGCLLAYDRYVYDLGTLEPGQPIEIGPATRAAELADVLRGNPEQLFLKKPSEKASASPYDQSSVDVSYILRAMTFFEAADGRRQTRLTNEYQQFVDLSGLLRAGRAVLVGLAAGSEPHPAAVLLRDSRPAYGPQDEHTTIYRFVLPVGKGQ
jgi:hypothetical protein